MGQNRLLTIKENWLKLAAKDKNHEAIGAYEHQYALGEPLSLDDIKANEANFNINYPEEYRRYITEVSNGGPSPYNGFYPLASGLEPFDYENYSYIKNNPDHYSRIFPFNNSDVIDFLIKDSSGEQAPPFIMNQTHGGYLFLAEYGCGGFFIMPIQGEQAGTVWFLQEMDDDSYHIYPRYIIEGNQAKQFDFLDWIEDWQNYHLKPGNFVPDPSESFDDPEVVETIIIKNKAITSIPDHIFLCKNLTSLIIRNCKIESIPDEILILKKLEKLDLFLSKISKLPDVICELKNLKELNFAGNLLESLPEKIGELSNLHTLNIYDNKIANFPESFYQLKNLKYLYTKKLDPIVEKKIKKHLPELEIIIPSSIVYCP